MSNLSDPRLPRLPRRQPDSHKGDYGRAVLIGGSRGMTGAIGMAGMATLRGGAGLVTLSVPDSCLETVAGYEPSYMTAPLRCDSAGRIAGLAAREAIMQLAVRADVLACGPGLGRSEPLVDLVSWLYETLPQPMVFDADALFALAARPDALTRPGGPRILTPHAGEFARLLGNAPSPLPLGEGQDEGRPATLPHPNPLPKGEGERPADLVAEHARRWRAVVVLKGHRTLVGDGRELYENHTGNPGMATGGSGDVLTGVITALLCQGLSPFAAAQLGVYVHGRAGDLAAEQQGEAGMIARDLINHLPAALREAVAK